MAADLVRRLRTCSAEERRAVAMKLAKTGTEDVVEELIRMVEGRRRCWLTWYNPDDQLIGFEAFGETRSKKALKYLRRIASYQISSPSEHMVSQWSGGTSVYKGNEVDISFPNAPEKLRQQLPHGYVISGPDEEECPLQTNRTYQKIVSAIKKLEAALQECPA